MSEQVLHRIPARNDRSPSPREKSRSYSPVHSSKRKSYLSESGDEKDEYSKKKHKKSKKKDKHKDKDREKSKKKEKKSHEEELSAIEKFNMFKKKREGEKDDGKIVDDLFKDFIASKLEEIESDNVKIKSKSKKSKDKKGNSVDEMSKFLDSEISNIGQQDVPNDKKSVKEKLKEQLVEKPNISVVNSKENDKLPSTMEKLKSVENKKQLGNFLKGKFNAAKEYTNGDKALEMPKVVSNFKVNEDIAVSDIPIRKEKELSKASAVITTNSIPLPSALVPSQENNFKITIDNTADKEEKEKPLPVFGPFLPRSVAFGEKTENLEEKKAEIKKPLGFKNFGIKLSTTSAELIQSGEIHSKGKRLEEGEVLSSSSDGSDSTDSDPDDDNEDDYEDQISGTGSISDSDGDAKTSSKSKKKKKKKKKMKNKKKKKHKDKEKDKDDVLVVGKDKSGSKRKISITPRSKSRSPKKSRRSRSKSKERSKRRSRSRSRDRGRSRRSRSRSRGRRSRSRGRRSRSRGRRSRSRGRRSRSRGRRSRSKSRRSRSRGRRSRSRSNTPDRFWRSKYGDFDAYKFFKGKRGRSKSRSPEREKDKFIDKERKRMEDLRSKIDKAKLREIAIKNALTNAKAGGPQLEIAIKSGGKSVEELTEYCKKIQEKEKEKMKYKNQYESSSDEEPGKNSDDEDVVHHPFKVKEPGAITFDIKDSKQLPVATPQERIAQTAQLRITFPVSSGSQHREKEWVPVEPDPVPKQKSIWQTPALMPPPAPPKPKQEVKVFEEPDIQPSVDISSIVSERLTAMKKLQENPNDITAKIVLDKAQQQATQWAASKNLPGQFLGSTGANILSQEELMGDKKRQAWLKKDVFTSAAPLTGGIGMFLLQKMGWKQGEGLGKNNEGLKEPLMLDFKVDRKGLVTTGEGKKGGQPKLPAVKDLSGKHPVSALGELCNKRRWGPPHYEVVHESGPAHKKDFLFKVKVNGTDYQPSVTSNNKKLAKAQAATVCLQELGLVPR